MKELPIYKESCLFDFVSRNPNWIYGYGKLKVSNMGSGFGTFEIYRNRLVLKFLFIPIRRIFVIDVEVIETWNSLYGARMRIFKKRSDSTLIVSTQQPDVLSNVFRKLGIDVIAGNERRYSPEAL